MLLDINSYVGHWPFKQLQYNTCSKLLERMNRFGVDVSVVSNINGIFYKNTQSANEELFEDLKSDRRFKERLCAIVLLHTACKIIGNLRFLMAVHQYPGCGLRLSKSSICLESVLAYLVGPKHQKDSATESGAQFN